MRTATRRLLLGAVAGAFLAGPLAAQQTVMLPKRDAPLAGAPTPVFAIGAEEGESWEMLSNVQAVAFDAQDNLYILDSGNFRVLVFDKGGRFLRQVGKQGNGPGELTFPLGVAIAPDGRIVVADMGRTGYAIFNADGSYVTNVAAPDGMRASAGAGIFVDATGAVIARSMPTFARAADGTAPEGPQFSPVVRHALTADAKPTTLYQIPMAAPRVQESANRGGRTMRIMMSAPPTFAAPSTWAALPNGGIAISVDPDYAVKLVDPAGKVQRIVQREEKPRRVTRRDQDAARDQLRERLGSPGGSGSGMRVTNNNGQMSFGFAGGPQLTKDQIEEQVKNMTFAEVMPLVQTVRTDPMGRIWVQRMPEQVGGTGAIDLLAGDGRYLGTITGQKLPDGISSSGLSAYIERNELDVQRVAVRRMPASWMVGVAGAGRVGDR